MVSNSIKFDHGDGGVLEYQNSGTALNNVMALGALLHTRFYNFDKNAPHLQFPTDSEGLKQGIGSADDLLNFINTSMSALGEALVFVERAEMGGSIEALGWLIKGLADLAADAEFARGEMVAALNYLREVEDVANR